VKLVSISLFKKSKLSHTLIKSVKRNADVKNTKMINHKIRRNMNRDLLAIFALFACMISHTNCNDNEVDSFKGFMNETTIIAISYIYTPKNR